MAISAQDVKALREKTGAGMMECKKALDETGGDFAKAERILKEKGLAAVAQRADRATNQGKVFIKTAGNSAALVEIDSETDFVSRNPEFIALGGVIAGKVLENGWTAPNDELNGMVKELATKIRENMSLKRVVLVNAAADECLSTYIHGDGAIGVIVTVSADKSDVFARQEAKDFAFTLALHVAAFNPLYLSREKVDPAFLQEQREIFTAQMKIDPKMEGKPEAALAKILDGKMNKYLSDICFVDQAYVKDDKIKVKQALEDIGKQVGANIGISGYLYVRVGA
jgi:elongation factor Ts